MKLSPLVKEFERQQLDFDVVHTGQHYDESMSSDFFTELEMKPPKFQFDNNNKPYSEMISDMITDISSILNELSQKVLLNLFVISFWSALNSL